MHTKLADRSLKFPAGDPLVYAVSERRLSELSARISARKPDDVTRAPGRGRMDDVRAVGIDCLSTYTID